MNTPFGCCTSGWLHDKIITMMQRRAVPCCVGSSSMSSLSSAREGEVLRQLPNALDEHAMFMKHLLNCSVAFLGAAAQYNSAASATL